MRRFDDAGAFRASVDERLRTYARNAGVPAMVIRRQAGLERLMARLNVAAPERWALKGGLALDTRLGDRARSSMDMDIDHADGGVIAREDLTRAAAVELSDHFTYAIAGSREVQEGGVRLATRYLMVSSVGGAQFEPLQVDVTLTAPEEWEVERAVRPGLLADLNLGPIEVFLTPVERQTAEKLHAYSRKYGSGASTRAKDLVDLVLMRLFERPKADRLVQAIDSIFAVRGTHPVPAQIEPPPPDWGAAFRVEAERVRIPSALTEAHRLVATWLDPVLQHSAKGEWDPGRGVWVSPGIEGS